MDSLVSKIIITSISLLNKNGISGFGIRAVAKEMKISTSTFYRYVRGREELYSLICEYICQNMEEPILSRENSKKYITELCAGLRAELLKIRHSAAIFYETVPVTEKHMELKEKIIKALKAYGVKNSLCFSSACILINYCLFSVRDEEFYREIKNSKNPLFIGTSLKGIDTSKILSFYQAELSTLDLDEHFLYGLDLLIKGFIKTGRG